MSTPNAIKLFIAADKETYAPALPFCTFVQAGSALANKRFEGFAHDDQGQSISEQNGTFRNLTVQYWAWKNQQADHYGFMDCDAYFAFAPSTRKADDYGVVEYALIDRPSLRELGYDEATMRSVIESHDIVTCQTLTLEETGAGTSLVRQWYGDDYRKDGRDFDRLMGIVASRHPDYIDDIAAYLQGDQAMAFPHFIMDHRHFNAFAEFQFGCLEQFAQSINPQCDSALAARAPEYLAPHLLGIYLEHCRRLEPETRIGQLNLGHFDSTDDPYPQPAFPQNNCPIVFSSSDFYSVFLGVALHSIMENASPDWNYDVIVLDTGMRDTTRMQLLRSLGNAKNVSLRFIKIERLIESRGLPSFAHITIGTYGRFLILDYLAAYDKVVYLDCDLVANADIAELYQTDLGDNLVAAVRDTAANGWYRIPGHEMKSHMDDVLRITQNCGYFNAGVMVMNLEAFRRETTCEELLAMAVDPKWTWLDQDILNHLCRNRVVYVDQAWNFMAHKESYEAPLAIPEVWLPRWLQHAYIEARLNPRIVHYAGHALPCFEHASEADDYWYFWKYARTSIFYERILKIAMSETVEVEQHSVSDHARHAVEGVKRAIRDRIRK